VAQTAASAELERLQPFVGTWKTEGEIKDGAPGKPTRFTATDIYEWLPGGHFLLHRFDADMPDGKVRGIEVIGYNRKSGSYPMRSYDNTGNASLMQARVEKGDWTFLGDSIRFTGRFRAGGQVFAGLWEYCPNEDGAWRPLMDVNLRKIG
jgi:hypothetical protein